MDILKIVETLQSYSDEVVAENMGSDFARAVTEAVSLLISQGEQLSDLDGGWIPVSLGFLPEEFVSVLVCIPTEAPLPIIKEAYLANGCWSTKGWIYNRSEVTHWMPMPKPPEEVQD